MRKSAFLPILILLGASASAQRAPIFDSVDETRAAMEQALAERQAAEQRSARFARQAEAASNAAEKAAQQAALLAARIQEAEAGIGAAEARIDLVDRERARLREILGREQRPVVKLTAALQQFSRRPVPLSVLKPGSVKDVVYLRAVLDSAVPRVQARTVALREQIARSRRLREEAEQAALALRAEEEALDQRRQELAALETRQRIASREAGGTAQRESERALALGEQARDLDALVERLDRDAVLRSRLAALPGPILRPQTPGEAGTANAALAAAPREDGSPPVPYQLPVSGRTITGFGAPDGAGLSTGLTLTPRAGAQVVAPAAGRVAFAGPYRGYGGIVIIEHAGGWTSLITGLGQVSVNIGQKLVAGSPLGSAGADRPGITLELRRAGEPVNPLLYIG
ncbi:septal ring factor EnvC (AmiA/AmiB activator) [Altererythrobacter atlanticus]|uniref:Murein hydrolase activator EnvC n=1 Tax=Croceibacterium atlanticum TaxID=1267766 RepID=A0A0F7KX73_9SPHN|nr:peptidoglycan DD-metalloendopeptidase family protein [Croceibacterium atlanticum]AKH43375.1 Murein hydrolase activator EnvC precursor [Croceibacterium atlanticum]MBB5731918.1 septal ring factor EnvC (AmiA/AmiB activator) [Croceibacterium atlanticum]